ncbi:hypothetical protein J6T93_08130, partial [bacterium]|nr:hypothetical protein [bacterium]
EAVTDPTGPATGTGRVRRGGWVDETSTVVKYFRIAYRVSSPPNQFDTNKIRYFGCRLVLLP